jgi:hypothetical protein
MLEYFIELTLLGTTLDTLWAYMAKDPTNQVDNYIKAFVWDLLQQQAELQIKVIIPHVSIRYLQSHN